MLWRSAITLQLQGSALREATTRGHNNNNNNNNIHTTTIIKIL